MISTRHMARHEPTPVAAWIRGATLAWYCQRCEAWHLNSHNRNEPEPVLRWPPAGCLRRAGKFGSWSAARPILGWRFA